MAKYITLLGTAFLILSYPALIAASNPLMQTHQVRFVYSPPDEARFTNAQAALRQLQLFLTATTWKHDVNYSFIRDVLHGTVASSAGYVDTPSGFAFGLSDAVSLLNQMVQTATFHDAIGHEQPVFETVVVWWWHGDKVLGNYGATIYVDPARSQNKDFIWRLNPSYTGTIASLTTTVDVKARTIGLTMQYSDDLQPQPNGTPPSTAGQGVIPTDDPVFGYRNTVQLQQKLTDLAKYNRFGVSIIPVGSASRLLEEVDMNADMETYVASAFKGPVALYFFENIRSSVWKTVPVRYWNLKNAKEVPAQYRDAWKLHQDILYDLWTTVVWSQNDSTGNVLAYVYRNSPAAQKLGNNPIIAFNNWAHQAAGVSDESGLHAWYDGATRCQECVDERYGHTAFSYQGRKLVPNNTYSARDLAKIYVHMAEQGKQLGYYDIATELMSTWRGPNAPSFIQWYIGKHGGIQTASKDGYVGPDDADSDGYYISTDAGLLTLPDGKQFGVAFMAFDAGNLLDDAMVMTANALRPDRPPQVLKNKRPSTP